MNLTDIGTMLVAFGLVSAVVSVVALAWGNSLGEKEGEPVTNVGYWATFAVAVFTTGAVALLTSAFLTEQLSFRYVVENRPNVVGASAILYRISGVWAGREGSFLFWAWLIAVFAAFVAYKRMGVTDRLSNVALAVTNVVQGLFLVLLMTPANTPFARVLVSGNLALDPATNQPLYDLTSQFMNPLLQTWAMVLHPPILFIGYAGLTIPFAYAIAALIVNDPSKRWVELSDRITVFSWLALGIGIGLGAIWAYYELAFGGFWAWDPVENASLLPWLTGVGLIHSLTVYRRRDSMKRWAIALSTLTFVMVILGTFITRSGVLAEGTSVHTFGGDPWAKYVLLTLILGSLAAGLGGIFLRNQTFGSEVEYGSLSSRDMAYEANNIIMTLSALLITYMTLSSVIPAGLSFLPGAGLSIGKETYESISRPIGILYVALMVVCPILAWRFTDRFTFWRRARWPLAAGGVLSALLIAFWAMALWPTQARLEQAGMATISSIVAGPMAIVGLIVAACAIAMPVYLFVEGTRKRAAARKMGAGTAFSEIITKARSQSGGYITHLGMGVILLGLIGSTMFVDNVQQNFRIGGDEKLAIGGYEFTLRDVKTQTRGNGDIAEVARLDIKGGGTITPTQLLPKQVQGQTNDPNRGRKEVAIIHEPLRDVFVTFQSNDGEFVGVDAKVFPLISFAWAGFVITILGSGLAAWPKRATAVAAKAKAAA